ncbi:MAG TPA: hypothetical protein VHB98_05860, partial [Chloroflexota bacterium]|nr:hypothetical protein [Chloroflexota bacterium]
MKVHLNRPSLYAATAATLFGFLLGGSATWASHADTHQAAPASAEAGIRAPAPPGEPTLMSTDTKYTTRLYGSNPYEEAVAVTQHVYTAALPLNTPNINNNDNDRPWGITLVTADDPIAGISAVPLIHFPNDAPILFVTKTGIPQVTLDEIKRLGDTGILRDNNTDIFAVGAASNPAVLRQLAQKGVCAPTAACKVQSITAPDDFTLANNIDKVYGSIENPDTGVPQMETSASTGGNGVMDVYIGSADGNSWQYILPATHFVSHMPGGLLWVHKNSVPAPTITALKRRMGRAMIYVFGGPSQVSASVIRTLNQYGAVTRITNDDGVAYNAPPTDNP